MSESISFYLVLNVSDVSTNIVLTTLNARYMHSAFGLRYLYANLGELQAQAQIVEFTISQRPIVSTSGMLKKLAK
jgi:hypothetical protein